MFFLPVETFWRQDRGTIPFALGTWQPTLSQSLDSHEQKAKQGAHAKAVTYLSTT